MAESNVKGGCTFAVYPELVLVFIFRISLFKLILGLSATDFSFMNFSLFTFQTLQDLQDLQDPLVPLV